jgi:hypothetical protein
MGEDQVNVDTNEAEGELQLDVAFYDADANFPAGTYATTWIDQNDNGIYDLASETVSTVLLSTDDLTVLGLSVSAFDDDVLVVTYTG